MGSDGKTCPAEENVEAICQFFNTIGKQLDESPKSRRVNDVYFSRLKELAANVELAPRLRFMVRDVLDLRANNWVPRREEVNFPYLVDFIFSPAFEYFFSFMPWLSDYPASNYLACITFLAGESEDHY